MTSPLTWKGSSPNSSVLNSSNTLDRGTLQSSSIMPSTSASYASQRTRQRLQNNVCSLPNSSATLEQDAARQNLHYGPACDVNPDNLDEIEEVVMAVDMKERGTVGCCYYSAREEKLYFMEDVKLGGAEIVDALKTYIEPTVVLVSTRIDDAVMDRLDPDLHDEGSSHHDGPSRLPYLLDTRPSSEFNYEAAKSKLVGLKIRAKSGPLITFTVPGDIPTAEYDSHGDSEASAGRQAQLLRLFGWIDVESRITVGCAGALLSYLQRRRAAAYLPGDEAAGSMFRIATIDMFSLNETMFINADTMLSLQIMQSETHPHTHSQGPTKSSSGSKEGLSVYGLFHHLARTPQGKILLRKYFLRPSLNKSVINERLDSISVLLRPDNFAHAENLSKNLSHVRNMRLVMIKLRKGINCGSGKVGGIARAVWASIRQFAFHVLNIRDIFQDIVGSEALLIRNKVLEGFQPYHLAQIGRDINETVDFEDSAEESRTVIRSGVDEELDELKHQYRGLNSLLDNVARYFKDRLRAETSADVEVKVYFLPQIGFLIAVPLDEESDRGVYEGDIDDTWEPMFTASDMVHYKNAAMHEMDNHFGDIHGIICDKEIEIAHSLAESVLEYEELLTTASDICAELDCLLALAQGAKNYNLNRPQVTERNLISITGANTTFLVGGKGTYTVAGLRRIPVMGSSQDQSPPYEASEEEAIGPSMLIMTGPNYSGKTVYLKQVALIVYMSQIGSFVPAESAIIGITDKILCRMTTQETVSRVQSAFMSDLQQISLALNLATRKSLLLIDEFGKGTEASDGAGLACAVCEHLISLGDESPKVLFATHFHEIFELGFLKPQQSLSFGHMEVLIDEEADDVENQITYLYNVKGGRSISSFGTSCAAMNGISSDIIRRAEEIIILVARGEDLLAACADVPESEAAELEEAERIARAFLEIDDFNNPRDALDRILNRPNHGRIV